MAKKKQNNIVIWVLIAIIILLMALCAFTYRNCLSYKEQVMEYEDSLFMLKEYVHLDSVNRIHNEQLKQDSIEEKICEFHKDSVECNVFALRFLAKKFGTSAEKDSTNSYLESSFSSLLSIYRKDSIEGESDVNWESIWHIGSEWHDVSLKVANVRFEDNIYTYDIKVYYGNSFAGIKRLQIIKELDKFKVYDVMFDDARKRSFWVRDYLRGLYGN